MKYSESNKPLVCMMTNSTCYKGTSKMQVKGVLWHSTGANNTTIKRYVQPSKDDPNYDALMKVIGKNIYGNDWNHIERQAGLNAWIGTLEDGSVTSVQTMPWDYKPWGCGGGSKGSCNDGWIQFEICESNLNDKSYFEKVYNEACELTAYLCKKYNINPYGTVSHNGVNVPTILCHKDSYDLKLGSGHSDVYHWFSKYGKTMEDVRNDVAKLMGYTVKPSTTTSSVAGTPSTGSAADEKKIWDYMMKIIGNSYGVAGMMGNLYAESGLRSNNMQNSYESKLGYTDATYTAAVDNGSYDNFVQDRVGYGIAQFTFYSLKQELLDYAKSKKKSIGDLDTQLAFLENKMKGEFKKVLNDLKAAKSVAEASNIFLMGFERPAAKDDINLQKKRTEYGQKYYDKYASKTSSSTSSTATTQTAATNTTTNVPFKIGDEVKLVAGAKYTSGASIPSWVFNSVLYVREIRKDGNVVISILKSGDVTGTVFYKYLTENKKVESKPATTTSNKTDTKPTSKFSIGDEVKLVSGAKYISGQTIPQWVFGSKLYVREIRKDGGILISTFKSGDVTGIVEEKYLVNYTQTLTFTPYKVQVTVSALNVRSGPGTMHMINKVIRDRGVYTIVEEKNGFGRLKSGDGWIFLNGYTKRV